MCWHRTPVATHAGEPLSQRIDVAAVLALSKGGASTQAGRISVACAEGTTGRTKPH